MAYKEGGTAILTITFRDENDVSIEPHTAWWSLYRKAKNVQTGSTNGYIVNGRTEVDIPSDDFYTDSDGVTRADVVLKGKDLQSGKLYFVAKGLYNSSIGSDLPVIVDSTLDVEPLSYV